MKKEKQIGVRVGLPVFFLLELEDIYKHRQGPHRALAFPDFVGLLVGMGLEAYRKSACPYGGQAEAPEDIEKSEPLNLFDIPPEALPDMFKDFDEAMERMAHREPGPNLRLVKGGA
jgi:hypothetical protein